MALDYERYQPHGDWYEFTFDDAKGAAALMGIDIDDILFSGFWSQGDGASFTGSYRYAKGAVKAIRAEYPRDTELHAIAEALAAAQRKRFYRLSATITQSGYYSHEMTMRADVSDDGREYGDASADDSEALLEAFRDLARWIYAALEREYEYQSAWELARGLQEAGEEAAAEKQEARALIADMRASRREGVPDSICAALRGTVRRHIAAMFAAREERDEIEREFAYWQDGARIDVRTFAAANL